MINVILAHLVTVLMFTPIVCFFIAMKDANSEMTLIAIKGTLQMILWSMVIIHGMNGETAGKIGSWAGETMREFYIG